MSNSKRLGTCIGALLTAALLVGTAPAIADVVAYPKIPDGAYAVVARISAKPGKEAALREASRQLIPAVRAEPNNLAYFLHESREEPGRFTFYEIFATQADFEAHVATKHVQDWFAKLPELADGTVQVTPLNILK
ncbi:putative quinol monooxygenase [Niveispirillum sp. KHB5.9]|uniref:putative quinol monooxygenase n=1 Tax=Niveispirillum sp. KHB5.9 TaxID=3400269 RepID=UPI003A8B4E0A